MHSCGVTPRCFVWGALLFKQQPLGGNAQQPEEEGERGGGGRENLAFLLLSLLLLLLLLLLFSFSPFRPSVARSVWVNCRKAETLETATVNAVFTKAQ